MTDILKLIAYKDGEYKPLGEIGPSVLDFGFIHCDATYDVMPVYDGKAFCRAASSVAPSPQHSRV